MRKHRARHAAALVAIALFASCASRVLQYEKADEVLKNNEYEEKVKVTEAAPAPPAPKVEEIPDVPVKTGKKKKRPKKIVMKKETPKEAKPGVRQPEIEDSVGFNGRRPVKDPFRVGEHAVYDLSYFSIVAGTLDLQVKPMVEVNGIRAYHFVVKAQSNSFFNRIYGVDDTAETYLSYEEMLPLNLAITLKETKQLAEARTFFDWKTLKANYWQKKVTKEKGEESKKLEWTILPYSQNVISAVYYMRVFSYELGKQYQFRVADEGKNIVFSGEIVRKEKLSTAIGDVDTIVLRPKLTVDGAFAPVGEILFWMTDDDRHLIMRMESKIKIGTLVAKLKSLDKGHD